MSTEEVFVPGLTPNPCFFKQQEEIDSRHIGRGEYREMIERRVEKKIAERMAPYLLDGRGYLVLRLFAGGVNLGMPEPRFPGDMPEPRMVFESHVLMALINPFDAKIGEYAHITGVPDDRAILEIRKASETGLVLSNGQAAPVESYVFHAEIWKSEYATHPEKKQGRLWKRVS